MKRAVQAALFAAHGVPRQLDPDEVDADGMKVVRVYAVRDRAAADAFVTAERETWGNPARAEEREGVGWCVVVDLRRVIEGARVVESLRRRYGSLR